MTARARRAGSWIGGLVAAGVVTAGIVRCGSPEPSGASEASSIETFEAEGLDGWEVTSAHDFRRRSADVVASAADGNRKLRLQADTMGTDPATVKVLGVRKRVPVALAAGRAIDVHLDWNGQRNGSYLSAGFVLSPVETAANPLDGADWLAVTYVGVPPGGNARLLVTQRTAGRDEILYDEGWPTHNRRGRAIGRQHLALEVTATGFRLIENGRQLLSNEQPAPFSAAYLYLQMSSHGNYAAREVFFDDVGIR